MIVILVNKEMAKIEKDITYLVNEFGAVESCKLSYDYRFFQITMTGVNFPEKGPNGSQIHIVKEVSKNVRTKKKT